MRRLFDAPSGAAAPFPQACAAPKQTPSRRGVARGLFALLPACALWLGLAPQGAAADERPAEFAPDEIVSNGHKFFGSISRGLAEAIESATRRWGKPNGYILGQEASGAFIGGLRYGEGTMYTRNAGQVKVFWQGPSLGFDAGADGARTMMLVYNLPSTGAIFNRFGGVAGSAYLVGGFGLSAFINDDVYVVPIRSGVGARLGVNVSYLKFTPTSTWNPF